MIMMNTGWVSKSFPSRWLLRRLAISASAHTDDGVPGDACQCMHIRGLELKLFGTILRPGASTK